ncbi:hypothetical protein BDV38DRAFT_274806 [Aspergillus pseudotamarii]|uniref:Uncharacterized protein n=1 Tax=Aspergillus pseudotamarii TaxID=132259 RepID=A0A5N6SDJ5_ASPPS|nr:uncharacterized protein BDV38DRAFT_274806 [Aspergillus pseudotamarii]KAE8132796.1 hypothetical protein BDV38DRAFT_274806 [Aspergillus pseudotamarii]
MPSIPWLKASSRSSVSTNKHLITSLSNLSIIFRGYKPDLTFKMKFSVPSALLVTATLSSVGNAAFPNVPETCLEIPQVLGQKPLKLMQYFHTQVCEKANCTATINQHNQYLHNNVLPQLIQDVNTKLGVSASEQMLYNQTSTQLIAAVQKSCAAEGNKPLCNNPEGLFNYGACAFKASQPVLEKQVKQLSSSVQLTEEKCQKIKQLDSDETAWSKTLPGYIDRFAALCEKDN